MPSDEGQWPVEDANQWYLPDEFERRAGRYGVLQDRRHPMFTVKNDYEPLKHDVEGMRTGIPSGGGVIQGWASRG